MSAIDESPTSRLRWLRSSLKTLLLFALFLTVAFGGWVQYMRYRARVNRERVAAFEKAVTKIDDLGGGFFDPLGYPLGPDHTKNPTWLERQFDDPGRPYDLEDVFFDTDLDSTTIDHLKRLASIKWMWLNGPLITDDSLENLKRLTTPEFLLLRSTRVTDQGVTKLQRALPKCQIERD